jgi:signal transduction histidine kinase
MAVTATASALLLIYLARPFIATGRGQTAFQVTMWLFSGAVIAGALAAIGGLILGLGFTGRIRTLVERANALSQRAAGEPEPRVLDELGALDVAVGRLSLSMNQFVRDSDILGRLPGGLLLLRPTGELLSFNAAAETLLAMPLESFQGMSVLLPAGALPLAQGNEALAGLLDEAAAARQMVHRGEIAVTTASGRSLLLELTVQPREWDPGSPVLVLLFRDASEKQRIRDEIRRADQLAFLGGMAARVAHEIRTPLATIRGLLELLQADLPEADRRREYIARILVAVDRQDRLVEDLLTLSNPAPEAWQAIPVRTLLDDVLATLPPDPRLHRTGDADGAPPPVWGDPFRLGEVFTNLIQNALEAAPASGTVEVRVEWADQDRVRVSVRNTGSGIPAELRERIFQPFFTTKLRGTGLGLAIARQIVDAHRGSLQVASDGGSETTFIVELPTTPPRGVGALARSEIGSAAHG